MLTPSSLNRSNVMLCQLLFRLTFRFGQLDRESQSNKSYAEFSMEG